MNDNDQIVHELQTVLANEGGGFTDHLEASLRQAHEHAEAELNPLLLQALPWPRDIDGYCEYLRDFIRWIPRQTDAEAWKVSAPEERYAKEVSDRLAHFFWIVDQPVDGQDGTLGENSAAFRDWLTQFARQWGSFLDTPKSFSKDILQSFMDDAPEYGVKDSLMDGGRPNTPSGWLTFNQFFARELNAGLRPIAEPGDNRIVTSPADCIFKHVFDIDADSNIPATTVKQTHRYGNIRQLLEGSRYANAFAGGTFAHYMLPPSAYHRYHVPVAGTVEESCVIQGRVYMQVKLRDGELVSLDSAKSGYEFSQTRGVVTIDTSAFGDDLGIVAVVPVGMSHVASVNLTTVVGKQVAKGDEFGFFQFGGSDIIVLFQAGVHPEIDTGTDLRHVGSVIACCQP